MTDKEKIQRAVTAAGSSPRSLRKNYSGRCMYGATCWGIVCAFPNDVVAEVGLSGALIDDMGKQSIVYWPKVTGE